MKKIVVMLIVGVLAIAGGGATAQEALGPSILGRTPLETESAPNIPDAFGSANSLVPPENNRRSPQRRLEPLAAPSESDMVKSAPTLYDIDDSLRVFDCQPALLESTGTWLRRGFWYAEADAVIFNRRSSKTSIILMSDSDVSITSNITLPDTFTNTVIFNKARLQIVGTKPGAETAPRLKVGRFLFRDSKNRDHNLEFVIFGGGNWSQNGQLEGGNLESRIFIDTNEPSFDGAQRSQYTYNSWFNTFELNYHVRQRMNKDRMELEPSGHWVRRAQPTLTYSFLAGCRYFDLDESLKWEAFGIPDANDDGDEETGVYDIKVGNHLIGTQVGGSTAYETARWSLTGSVKGGLFVNMIHAIDQLEITGGLNSQDTDKQADNAAWISEFSLIGRWHMQPNVSLRAGLELMHLSGLSLAPHQIDFVPGVSPNFSMGSDLVYVGGIIGMESYW